ncbi:hypothetical protein ACO0LO_26955 [Undibacterium sp. TJN25]|uniref:hypothetical protein n=1 Tax=Undibacterium sp. TJN25 TaxID=3413056 RepID=UPI003BF1160B
MTKDLLISANKPLLSQQPAPVSSRQAELTRQFLAPLLAELEQYLLAVRAETDAALAPLLSKDAERPYPKGRCTEISLDVQKRMQQRLSQPQHPVEQALVAFLRGGGIIRHIWGALRESYFQNAFQFGALYVDVSNDTVVVTKPKVEILPMEDSGLLAIADLPHFARVAERYWNTTLYANHAAPSLAPVLPMIGWTPGSPMRLHSVSDYMIDMMRRDAFKGAREWLASAPVLPDEVAAQLRQYGSARVPIVQSDGGKAALAACDSAAQAEAHLDLDWRAARIADYFALVANAATAQAGDSSALRAGSAT